LDVKAYCMYDATIKKIRFFLSLIFEIPLYFDDVRKGQALTAFKSLHCQLNIFSHNLESTDKNQNFVKRECGTEYTIVTAIDKRRYITG